MKIDIVKLIQIFQTHYKLEDYIPQYGIDDKISGLDADALFVYIIKCIVYYHIIHETEIAHVPEFEKAYDMVGKVINTNRKTDWYLYKIQGSTIVITKILDVIFLKLRDVIKTIDKFTKNAEKTLDNWSFSMGWVTNISYITFLLFYNTDIIPKGLGDMLLKELGYKPRKHDILFNKCRTVFQKGLFGSKYNVCNIILKDNNESRSIIQPYISLDTVQGIRIMLGIIYNLFGKSPRQFDEDDFEVAKKLEELINMKH